MKDKRNRINQYIIACIRGDLSVSLAYCKPSDHKIAIDMDLYSKYILNSNDRYTGYRIIAHNNFYFTVGILDDIDKKLVVLSKSDNYQVYDLSIEEWNEVHKAYLNTQYRR